MNSGSNIRDAVDLRQPLMFDLPNCPECLNSLPYDLDILRKIQVYLGTRPSEFDDWFCPYCNKCFVTSYYKEELVTHTVDFENEFTVTAIDYNEPLELFICCGDYGTRTSPCFCFDPIRFTDAQQTLQAAHLQLADLYYEDVDDKVDCTSCLHYGKETCPSIGLLMLESLHTHQPPKDLIKPCRSYEMNGGITHRLPYGAATGDLVRLAFRI